MARFDFMTDDELRASLEADVAQMDACLEVAANKAAQVLAGSIVEALLADHMGGLGPGQAGSKSVLEMSLGELVGQARSLGVISATTADLASVIKEYRNLIHPGRVIRLAETVDDHTARIAKDLVEIIANEIAKVKRASYGNTANRLLRRSNPIPRREPSSETCCATHQHQKLNASCFGRFRSATSSCRPRRSMRTRGYRPSVGLTTRRWTSHQKRPNER